MYEMTHGGVWFKWSALSRAEKGLAGIACVAAMVPGVVLGSWLGHHVYHAGHRLASGGKSAALADHFPLVETPAFDLLIAAAILSALVCGVAWWRFSRRQDELFNRVQNYALGHGSAWTMAFATLWWMASLAGWLPPFPLGALVTLALVLVLVFWMIGVRRWG